MSYQQAITRNTDPDERKAFIKARDDEFFINLVQNGVVEYVHTLTTFPKAPSRWQ